MKNLKSELYEYILTKNYRLISKQINHELYFLIKRKTHWVVHFNINRKIHKELCTYIDGKIKWKILKIN